MERREKLTPDFRGGIRGDHLGKRQLFEQVSSVLDIAAYKQIPLQTSIQAIDRNYLDNKDFWQEALADRQFESMRVQLKSFHLTEWIPLTPGRYFTSSAQESRSTAKRSFNQTTQEYDLNGKTAMFFGGIGSVRFTAKTIASEMIYFLGASSNGISHQGIPIALREPEYRQVIQIIKSYGGCVANIVGTLRILPLLLSPLIYDGQVPKHCLVVDQVEVVRPSESSQLSATISVTFQLQERILADGWTFNTFRPGSTEETLDMAVERLQNYIKRYSGRANPVILADFDEQYQHFTNPIEFPISQVFKGNINTDRTNQYGIPPQFIAINAHTVHTGEGNIIDANLKVDASTTNNIAHNNGSSPQYNMNNNAGRIDMNTSTSTDNTTNKRHLSPWLSGSYYLVVFLSAIGALCIAGRVLPLLALPIVVIGGILALSIIGALQLRQDEKLSQENFVKLMTLELSSLSFIKPPSQKSAQGTIPPLPSHKTSIGRSKTAKESVDK